MDKILDSLMGQAPAVLALIWAITYMGAKIDRLSDSITAHMKRSDEQALRAEGQIR